MGKAKLQADGVVLTQGSSLEVPEVEGSRLVMAGPGEYEVGGVKVSGVRSGELAAYYLSVDGIMVLVGSTSGIKSRENAKDADVSVLLADSVVDQSALATVTNNVAVFYGPQAEENIKSLGKEIQPVGKYVITKDKLPQEMEVVLLA